MENKIFRFYEFGGFKLDSKRRILFKNEEQIHLSARVFDLLLIFVQNEGKILEHDELLDKVWEGTFVEQSNLKKSVSALRQILGENPNQSLYIKTVPRRGYCFVASVKTVDEIDESIISENKIESTQPETKTNNSKADNFLQKNKFKFFALAATLSIGIILILAWKFGFKNGAADNFKFENLKIQKLTTAGNVSQAAISPDGKMVVYTTYDNLSRQTLWAKRIGQTNSIQLVPAGDEHYEDVAVSPDNNSVYFGTIKDKSQEDLFRIPISGGVTPRKITEDIASIPTFSPDSKQMVFVRDTPDKLRRLIIANAEDGSNEREIYNVPDKHNLIAPAWSPDGKRIAFVSSDVNEKGRTWTISEISPDGGAVRAIFPPKKEKVLMATWLRNGSGLIMAAEPADSRQMQIWQVAYPGGEISRLTNDFSDYDAITLSYDGNAILSVQSDRIGDLWSMNWTMLQNTTRLTETQNLSGVFSVLPDGRFLCETMENGQYRLQMFNSDGTNPQIISTSPASERAPTILPDGKNLLYISRRSGTQEVWKSELDGRNATQVTNDKTFSMHPKISPDGKEVFYTVYDNAIWRLAKIPINGGEKTFLIDEPVNVFSFSPDGKFIAYNFQDPQTKRWMIALRNVSDFKLVKQFDVTTISLLDWSPDGNNIIYNSSETFRDGGSLWLQPIDGSKPKLLLETKDDRIYWVSWSLDKQKLFMTRGRTVSNIVLFTKTAQ